MIHFLPYSFFQWCTKTSLAQLVAHSKWGFAVLETFHIIGLTLLLGSIVVVDLRVLGFGLGKLVLQIEKTPLLLPSRRYCNLVGLVIR